MIGRLHGGQTHYSYSLSAAQNGKRLSCLQVKYSLFMECVKVLFPRSTRRTMRWEEEEEDERNYMLIYHKCRLRCQLEPALGFPPQNGELSIIIVENLPQFIPARSSFFALNMI